MLFQLKCLKRQWTVIISDGEADFLNEYEESNDFLYGILLGLFGLVITYKGWIK